MSTKTVAIAGITGKMGRLIAESLLRRPNVQIHGIARNPSKAPAVLTSAPNVKIFEAAADDVSSIRKALKGVDITISCYLGDNKLMVDGQKLLIDASIAENVPRFIAGDWSLDYRSLKLGDLPSKDPMIKVAQYLREKEQYEQIQGVHVLCGVFVEILTSAYGGWMNAAKDEITYFGSGDEEYDMTTMVDAAAFTAQVAMDSGATGYLQVRGDRKSPKGMAKAYENVYHVAPKMQCKGTLEDCWSRGRKLLREKPMNPYAWMMFHYHYWMGSGKTDLKEIENERYPDLEFTSLDKFLKHTPKEQLGGAYQNV